MSAYIKVMSERIMKPGFEGFCSNVMRGVQTKVKTFPGLMDYETLQDADDHHKYVVITTWKSRDHLDAWLVDPEYKDLCKKLETVLETKPSYRVLRQPKEDIFLL